MEKVHRGNTADDIDLQLRNSKKDSNMLARSKKMGKEEAYSCEQTKRAHSQQQVTHKYNQWKYKRRREENKMRNN
eukprot:16442579-Heterocapsa_arctica.AAC.1